MKINIGKKIGGVYVGTSVESKSVLKSLWDFITFPFYIITLPFVKLYRHFKGKKNAEQKAATTDAQSIISTMQAAAKVCEETKTPEEFFTKYKLLRESIEKLSALDGKVKFGGATPAEIAEAAAGENVTVINGFIDRYAKDTRLKIYELSTEKEKANKASAFRSILSEYDEYMEAENIAHYNKIADELSELAAKPIG